MSQSRKLYSCNKCQWVHFGVSRTEGGDTSKNCFRCGNPHTDFSPSDGSGCPTGSTIQGILSEEGHGDIPASGQESGKTPLEIISKQLAPMLVPGSFQSTKQTPRQDTTPKTKSTTWLVDAELDLSKGPLLFLALNSINGGMSPNPKWPRLWVRTRHQAGGLSCNSEELMGTVLQPLPAVAEKVRELARRWDGSNAGAMGDSLKEVTGYAADLKELLGALTVGEADLIDHICALLSWRETSSFPLAEVRIICC